MDSPTSTKKTLITGACFVVLVGAIVAFAVTGRKEDSTEAVQPDTTPTQTNTEAPVATTDTSASKYKDGTYSATGSYRSPGGTQGLKVSLTLKDDVVTDVNVTEMPTDPTSANYQKKFISGYKASVVGKNIDSIKLDKISGSSLTGAGFNDALSKIEVQAQA